MEIETWCPSEDESKYKNYHCCERSERFKCNQLLPITSSNKMGIYMSFYIATRMVYIGILISSVLWGNVPQAFNYSPMVS